jgi:hypothetical protein
VKGRLILYYSILLLFMSTDQIYLKNLKKLVKTLRAMKELDKEKTRELIEVILLLLN